MLSHYQRKELWGPTSEKLKRYGISRMEPKQKHPNRDSLLRILKNYIDLGFYKRKWFPRD